MKKNIITLAIAISGCIYLTNADFTAINQTGVGVRAYSFANNYVALSNDLSSVYWNPAALSFLPVREFQVSSDILRNFTTNTFNSTVEKSGVQRLRLDNIGLLTSVPTSKGGLTFAAAYQSPYIFDDNPSFSGNYVDAANNSIQVDRNYRDYGNLNFWSGAFGLQIAQGLGIGASFSFVSGKENLKDVFYKLTNGTVADTINDNYESSIVADYLGYDMRFGLMYTPNGDLRFGLRLVLPQTIWFNESYDDTYPSVNQKYSGSGKGELYSSYSGAMGVSYSLRFMTLSSEVRFRAPYDFIFPNEEISGDNLAHRTNMGAGLGAESPLWSTNMILRAGYSWDQYDPYMFVRKYDAESSVNWSSNGINVDKDRNLITAGLAYVTSSWCIEGSYGCQFWNLSTKGSYATLTEEHTQHRFLLSFSMRY